MKIVARQWRGVAEGCLDLERSRSANAFGPCYYVDAMYALRSAGSAVILNVFLLQISSKIMYKNRFKNISERYAENE